MKLQHFLATTVAVALFGVTAQDSVAVEVNGKALSEKGMLHRGTTYVPIKAIATALGGTASFDGKTVHINVARGTARADKLSSVEGAWIESDANTWTKEATEWLKRADTLLGLIDFDAITYLTDGYTQEKRRGHSLNVIVREYLVYDLRGYILLDDWINLKETVELQERFQAVLDEIDEICDDHSMGYILRGAPSGELVLDLLRHLNAGLKLRLRLYPHCNALVQWYSDYPRPTP